jgi:kynurenine 3-monooxygenase
MFIAIPSPDKSFTCTLFAPDSVFATLTTPATLLSFFSRDYASVVDLVGADSLCTQFFANQHLPLVSIRTAPYHYSSRCVILGDAAHAMVPFYGQGMNAGFESVNVLFQHLNRHPTDLATALASYTAERKPDAWAIVELAMRNHEEMRSGVTKPAYLLRKWVEESLNRCLPCLGVRTLYSMISFGNGRYSEVLRKAERQGRVEESVVFGLAGTLVLAMAWRSGLGKAFMVGAREGWKSWVNSQ